MKKLAFLVFAYLMVTLSCLGQSINSLNLTFPANGAGNVFVSVVLDWSRVNNNQLYLYEVNIPYSFNSSLKISGTSGRNSANNFEGISWSVIRSLTH